jgi:cobalt-zinc-cadmium efflux system membrane fusion protein
MNAPTSATPSRARFPGFALAALLACAACRPETDLPAPPGTGAGTQPAGHEDGHGHEGLVHLAPGQAESHGVRVGRAELRELAPILRVPARIEFNLDAMAHVGTPVAGRVVELTARIGERVERGAELLVVESADLGEAQADYAQKRGLVESAEPAVRLTRDAFQRASELFRETEGIALAEVRRREAELRAAEASQRAAERAADAARQRLRILGMSDESIADLDAGKPVRARHAVRAPIGGTVVEREVTLGELVSPERDALLVLADLDHLWCLADVPESRLGEIAIGAPARVLAGGHDGHGCQGRVDQIGVTVDPRTRTARVRIEAADRHDELRPGAFVEAEIQLAASPEARLAIPEAALVRWEGRDVVFVPGHHGADSFELVPVVLGERVGGWVEVVDGLQAGAELVVAGAFVLKAELGKHEAEHQH